MRVAVEADSSLFGLYLTNKLTLMLSAIVENFLRKLLQQQKRRRLSGGWFAIAIGCLFIMQESNASNIDCEAVTVLEMKIANKPPSFVDLGSLASGILVASHAEATVIEDPKNGELVRSLRLDPINISQPLFKALAYGPEIAAEDEIVSTEAHCISGGTVINTVVRLAVPPSTGSRRRVVWRPILSILVNAKASFRLNVNWIKRSPDHTDVVVASHKEIAYSPVNK